MAGRSAEPHMRLTIKRRGNVGELIGYEDSKSRHNWDTRQLPWGWAIITVATGLMALSCIWGLSLCLLLLSLYLLAPDWRSHWKHNPSAVNKSSKSGLKVQAECLQYLQFFSRVFLTNLFGFSLALWSPLPSPACPLSCEAPHWAQLLFSRLEN